MVITAAAGGVGHFAVQFAKYLGANVVAVASERQKEWLVALGATTVVNYTKVRFEDHIRDADVVLELVGDASEATTTRAVRVLRPGGLLVAVPSGVPSAALAAADKAGVRVSPLLVEPDGQGLRLIAGLLKTGDVKVIVAEVFAFEDVVNAHKKGQAGRTRGKLVLRVIHDD